MNYLSYNFPANIKAFSTRRNQAGSSEGNYAKFNCTHYCGDNPNHVANNRKKLCNDWNIHPDRLIIPRQTHGTRIVTIDEQFVQSPIQERTGILEGCDALITHLPHCCLCISTADCVPIVLYDSSHNAIAAIHAGWRGTVAGITSKTIQAMSQQFGSCGCDIQAAIGPSISLSAFEVGDEVHEAFLQAGFDMTRIAKKEKKWHIDLWEANYIQLTEQGIRPANIQVVGICTYQHHETFFSARKNGVLSGRMLTGIMRIE